MPPLSADFLFACFGKKKFKKTKLRLKKPQSSKSFSYLYLVIADAFEEPVNGLHGYPVLPVEVAGPTAAVQFVAHPVQLAHTSHHLDLTNIQSLKIRNETVQNTQILFFMKRRKYCKVATMISFHLG